MSNTPFPSAITDQIHALLNREAIIAVTDRSGCIVHANHHFCEISGYEEAELVGKNHRILKSGVHSVEFYREMWKQIWQGETWRGEICNRAKDGHLYWVDTIISPVLSEGKISHFLSIRIDITARKRAEAEVRERVREEAENRRTLATGRMARAILHDLNNVLTGVMGLASEATSTPQSEMLNDAVRRMAQMTHTLKNFSCGEPTERSVSDVNEMVKCACSMASYREDARDHVRIIPQLGATKNVKLCCDEGQVFEAVLNLCVNAVEATLGRKGGGLVTVETGLNAGMVVIDVIDNGPGISESVLGGLFEGYVSSKGSGRGTGLAASCNIIRAHEGTLVLADAGGKDGRGAHFRITLPAHETVPIKAEPEEQPNPGEPLGLYALICDDDEGVQRLVRRAAPQAGLYPAVLPAGVELEQLVERARNELGLVVIDSCQLELPNNRVAKVRSIAPEVPILLISAAEKEPGPADTPWGTVERLPKPFSIDQLAEAMRRCVEAKT